MNTFLLSAVTAFLMGIACLGVSATGRGASATGPGVSAKGPGISAKGPGASAKEPEKCKETIVELLKNFLELYEKHLELYSKVEELREIQYRFCQDDDVYYIDYVHNYVDYMFEELVKDPEDDEFGDDEKCDDYYQYLERNLDYIQEGDIKNLVEVLRMFNKDLKSITEGCKTEMKDALISLVKSQLEATKSVEVCAKQATINQVIYAPETMKDTLNKMLKEHSDVKPTGPSCPKGPGA